MPFNSLAFFIFLPTTAAVYWLLKSVGGRWAQYWLLAASVFYYGYGRTSNLPLLAASILFNWALARVMMMQADQRRRRRFLVFGLTANIVLLFLFKYINLFLTTIASLGGPHWHFPDWNFPLGVSFFTLTQIMYLVDAYPRAPESAAARRIFCGLTAPNSLLDHATYVCMFSYVVSGPLVRARDTVRQLHGYCLPKSPCEMACRGVFLFSIGLIKKVVVADSFAPVADAGFGSLQNCSFAEAWVYCFAALLQLYFDFSGYSDMAVGSAWIFGIDIPQNFNAPLKARSIAEFWQRWHISLSNFITDYLYTPLLRALGKPTLATSAAATVIAMTIAALWHGPAWTFAAWGLSHGIALATHQAWKRANLHMPDIAGRALTLIFVTCTITFLRAPDLHFAGHMLARLVPHAHAIDISNLRPLIPFTVSSLARPIAVGTLLALAFQSSKQLADRLQLSFRTATAAALCVLLAVLWMNSVPARQFIYFGF